MTTPDRHAWAAAFTEQARSDWNVYQSLRVQDFAPCHALHYLQMACEKIGKAYRCRETEVDLAELLSRHVGFVKFLRTFLQSPLIMEMYAGRTEQLDVIKRSTLHLAREVEKLAPAVDPGSSPENSEYPWTAGDRVIAPCNYEYPNLSLLKASGGRAFLKLVALAMDHFER